MCRSSVRPAASAPSRRRAAGDLTAILGLIEFVRPDKLITRYLVAPRAPTQAEMNQIYALDSELCARAAMGRPNYLLIRKT